MSYIDNLVVLVRQSLVVECHCRSASCVQEGDVVGDGGLRSREGCNHINVTVRVSVFEKNEVMESCVRSALRQNNLELSIVDNSAGEQCHDRNCNDVFLSLGIPAT